MSKLAPGQPDVSASGEKAVPARLSEVAACNVRTAARLVAPGNRYDGFQRRAMAEAALGALAGCGACEALQRMCVRGCFWSAVREAHGGAEEGVVHALAAHQSRWDRPLYERAAAALPHGEQALAEVIVLVALAASYATYYTAQGLPVPPLPPAQAGPALHLNVDQYARSTARSRTAGFSTRVTAFREDFEFPEPFSQPFLTTAILPLAHVSLAPFDVPHFMERSDLLYVNTLVAGFTKMPQSRRDFITRAQIEYAAAEYAAEVACSF